MNEGKTVFSEELSDKIFESNAISKEIAEKLFDFFRSSSLFKWQPANNDCEDRANAACLLLERWNIPCAKAWVFSGTFLKKDDGQLTNKWNYHVAAALPVKEEDNISFYVLDPATLSELETIANWAAQITETAFSHHLVKQSNAYIFNPASFTRESWYSRNRQNYKWTIQGLAGINGVTKTGKAQLVFNKSKIKKTEQAFRELLKNKPHFLV